MTIWTEFVKKFAKDNNTTYGCALSNPDCSAEYRQKYGVKKPLGKKKEKESMMTEDINRASKRPPPKTPQRKQQLSAVKQKLNKKNTQKQLIETVGMMAEDINQNPVQDIAGNFIEPTRPRSYTEPTLETIQREQSGMMAEDKPKRKGGRKKGSKNKPVAENISITIEEIKEKAKKSRGRPKKYATAEEARKAKIANTIAGAKRRKEKKGGAIIDRVNRSFDVAQQRWQRSNQLQEDKDRENAIFNELWGQLFNYYEDEYGPDLTEEEEDAEDDLRDYFDWVANLVVAQPPQQGEGIKKKKGKIAKGKGLFNPFNIFNIIPSINRIKKGVDTATAVVMGRNDYPPIVRQIISKYGSNNITGIILCRTPLGKSLMTVLQLASGNTFAQRLQNTPYDKLFHLFVCIEFANGNRIMLEKNEVINASVGCKLSKDAETRRITSIPNGLTLNDALEKTRELMGNSFFTYSAKDNNCQDFISSFLKANNIGDETDNSWVKQDTQVLFEGNDRLRKIANTFTDIGAKIDVIRQGAGIKRPQYEGQELVDNGIIYTAKYDWRGLNWTDRYGRTLEGFGINPCWAGYEQIGMKKKRGKKVPNCVPKKVGSGPKRAKSVSPSNVPIDLPDPAGEIGVDDAWNPYMDNSMYVFVLQPLNRLILDLHNHRMAHTLTQQIIDDARNTSQNIYTENENLIENQNNPLYNNYLQLENTIDNTLQLDENNLGGAGIKKGGMADGYHTPPPYIPITPAQGNLILNNIQQPLTPLQLYPILMNILENIQGGNIRQRFRDFLLGFNQQAVANNVMRLYDRIIRAGEEGNTDTEGAGLKKKSTTNIKMPNKWISYVKDYAKKHNMKYTDALKDPKCKAGYKKGGALESDLPDAKFFRTPLPDTETPLPGVILNPKYIKKPKQIGKYIRQGSGLNRTAEDFIAELYNQANLGANGRVNLN